MQAWRRERRAEILAAAPATSHRSTDDARRPRQWSANEKAALLELVRQAIRDQATIGIPILEGVRARLGIGVTGG